MAGALIHCGKLFAVDLSGNRFLVRPVLEGLHKTFGWINLSNELFQKARLSAIKLLLPLIAISKVYHNHKIKFEIPEAYQKQDSISMIVKFFIFNHKISDIYAQIVGIEYSGLQRCCFYFLISSLIKEKSAENLKLIFLVVSTFLAETVVDNLIFVNTVLQLLMELIISDGWANNVLIDCLELVERCAEYYLDDKTVTSNVKLIYLFAKDWAYVKRLVACICRLVERKIIDQDAMVSFNI